MKTLTMTLRWINDLTGETFSTHIKLDANQLNNLPNLDNFLETVYLKLTNDVEKHIEENPDD